MPFNDIVEKETSESHKHLQITLGKLRRSTAIRKLWPDAFKYGKINSWVGGDIYKPATLILVIENGAGKSIDILLKNAPKVLRDYHVGILMTKFGMSFFAVERLERYFAALSIEDVSPAREEIE